VLKRIHARTLTAERDGKRWLVFLPSEPSSERFRTEDGTGSEPIEAQYRVTPAEIEQAIERTGDKYLADMQAMLAPLVAQITEQAETIGRITAERDQAQRDRDTLQARVSTLEERHAESPMQPSSAPQTATDAATDTSWWQFWRR